ncbi:aspartate--tRNA(Asn) ligase [Candidatus Woesearchaeota archaeon]|nr:aspartate--tRNA(Asn) ligase [Candidatus Woesearchaeota archaeon]
MEKRILIKDLGSYVGAQVSVAGWVDRVRDQKKMQFLVIRDHTGSVQAVNFKGGGSLDDLLGSLAVQTPVRIGGRLVQSEAKLQGYEIVIDSIEPASTPHQPFPISPGSGIDARLDWRHLDLRQQEKYLIFRVQTTAEHAMREFWLQNGFVEIHSPKLVEGASESGAELFKLDYFGQEASLAQSPQFYKQMAMAAGFDRVFEIGPVFRANRSFTPRHDTEFTSVDMEISWIDSHEEVMGIEERWLQHVLKSVADRHGDEIRRTYGIETAVPETPFPRVTIPEAYEIIKGQGYTIPRETKGDLDPEGERRLAKHIKETHDHEFVFVTDYPAGARPFYHMRFPDRPTVTKSFDLLWKGLEVTTGAQREHRYDILLDQVHEKGVNPASIKSYLDFFRYGMPPHGGLGFGLTRMLMNMTGLENVREVTFVYRGPTRLRP